MSASSQRIHQIIQFGDHGVDFTSFTVKVVSDNELRFEIHIYYG